MPTDLKQPKERSLFFSFQVDQKSINELTKEIIAINSDDDYLEKMYLCNDLIYNRSPIKIYIDSYGGNVYQCLGIMSIIDKSITPIYTIVTGCAISCGFLILISGHKRFAYKHSTIMYHQVSSGIDGKVTDMGEYLKEVERLQVKFEEFIIEKTNIKTKKLDKINRSKKDWYIEPKEALELNIINEIL